MSYMPKWNPPADLNQSLEDGEGFWEDPRWTPILLTAMSGTEFEGREIPVAWQIEFDPSCRECESSNGKLEQLGFDQDGYGWANYIQQSISQNDPALANRLYTTDSEASTCVIWVEAEVDCRILVETAWRLIHGR